MANIKISILCENTAGSPNILGEHGFSALIESGVHKILFDTGAGHTLKHNAQLLNIDLTQIPILVLSHGHYDHTGGIYYLFEPHGNLEKLYVHPSAFIQRYIRYNNNTVREIGYHGPDLTTLLQKVEITHTSKPTQIAPQIITTGEIPRTNPIEDVGGPFYLDPETTTPDPIIDDQSLIIEGTDTFILITGCCHSGIINTLEHVTKNILQKHKKAIIIGGLHLHQASTERLNFTLQHLKQFPIKAIYPCHCTGFNAIKFLAQHLPVDLLPSPSGSVHFFEI